MDWLAYYHLLEKYNGELERATARERQAEVGSDPKKAVVAQRLALEVWRRQNGLPYVMGGEHFRLSSVNGDQGPDSKTVLEHLGADSEPMVLSRADMAGLLEIFGRLQTEDEEDADDNGFE
jgi:hypothetical protein